MPGMKQSVGGVIFALAVGLALAWYTYRLATDPAPRAEREVEEAMVRRARAEVASMLGDPDSLEIVDPLRPNRIAGKSYVYPTEDGWAISGFYRRDAETAWLPWLVGLDEAGRLKSFSAQAPNGVLEVTQ